jgi:hypothetical protein
MSADARRRNSVKFFYGACWSAALLILLGCRKPAVQTDVPGTYEASYPEATEELIITSDGTYSQIVKLTSETNLFESKGKWEFDSRGPEVVFDQHFLLVLDGFGKISGDFPQHRSNPTAIPMQIGRSITGRLRLGVDPGIIYTKTK